MRFVLVVAFLFLFPGSVLRGLLGLPGMVAAEWLLLLAPALIFVRHGGWSARSVLSLGRPSSRGVVGGLLLVAGAMPVGWLLAWLQTWFLPVPWEMLEAMETMLTVDSPARLAWLLFAVAVTPAVCEEAVFRGVLLGSTRSLAPWRFLLLNGGVFGLFHLSLESPIRFLPTAWLGIVLAWAVWRSGSLWVGVLMHLANNGAILLASVAAPPVSEAAGEAVGAPPLWVLPPALLALAAGASFLRDPDGATAAPPTPTESDDG